MTKFKITLTVECEYFPSPENYPDPDLKAMIRADMESFQEDPMILLEMPGRKTTLKGEILQAVNICTDLLASEPEPDFLEPIAVDPVHPGV